MGLFEDIRRSGRASARLRVLGGVSLTRDERSIGGAAAQRQSLALLAVLAVHEPHGISREKLGALLWPESAEANYRNNLKQAVHVLRRELGSESVLGTTTLHLGTDAVACDLIEFERQRARGEFELAVAQYGGPFLEGFHLGGDAEEFERWSEGERVRLAREHADALDALATAATAGEEPAPALELWRRLASVDPLNSRAARGTVAALVALGDPAGALGHAESYREALRRELGLPLEQELEGMVAAIRARVPGDDAPRAPVRSIASGTTVPAPPAGAAAAHRTARRPLYVGGVIASVALAGVLVRCTEISSPPVFDARRVVVAAYSRSDDDPATVDARRLVAEGIARRLTSPLIAAPTVLLTGRPADPRSAAAHEGAGMVISLPASRASTGVIVEADLTDVVTGQQLWSSPPIIVATGGDPGAVDLIAERAATAAAVRIDPKLMYWIAHASQPSSIDSYLEFRLGLELYFHFQPEAALSHFLAVAARDTAFTMSLVLASWSDYDAGNAHGPTLKSADSINRVLRPRRLAPLDRALVEHQAAVFRHDLSAAYLAAGAISDAAPNSEWRYLLAESAFEVGRAREAVRVSEQIDPDVGFLPGFQAYWTTLGRALHVVGDHEHELTAMKEARRRFPADRIIAQAYVRALAASGRVAEVESEVDRAITFKQKNQVWANQPMETAIRELWAHGYDSAAKRIAVRTVDWIEQLPPDEKREFIPALPFYLQEAGRITDAQRMFAQLLAHDPAAVDSEDMAVISAAAGDRATARRVDAQMARVTDPEWLPEILNARARIAASLGEREAAVRFLSDAYRAGLGRRDLGHIWREFGPLHGYPPFETLTAPVD